MNLRTQHPGIATMILAMLIAITGNVSASTPSATGILDKASSALIGSKGISASYTIKAGGQTQQGTLNVKGKKFSIINGDISTWYDGKTMWNYNHSDKEVTISTPTNQELATMNPYTLIASYKTLYTPQLQTSAIKGTYAISLIPKSAQSPVKKAVVYIRASDYQPVRLDVTSRNGSVSVIVVTNIRKGVSFTDASFVFPSAKYKGCGTIDLR